MTSAGSPSCRYRTRPRAQGQGDAFGEVDVRDVRASRLQRVLSAEVHRAALGVDARDERGPPERDAEAPPLPDREAVHALVRPDARAVLVDDERRAARGRRARSATKSAYACAPLPTKQSSWLSPLPAPGSARATASARTSALVDSPSGKTSRSSHAARRRVEEVALVLRPVGAHGQARGARTPSRTMRA